ncbi:cell division protein ZapA [Paenibacillus sp. FA6]|uniref:cell division protein ZapA n=1 Tax=Paenibacillus sp. FA6 TaxID=3413029 RepID=UPI003F65A6D7
MNLPERTRVTVEIYGSSYKIVGSSSDYMKKIAQYVDERMNSISKSHSRLDTPKIAVLAAVHMAEEAIQTQEVRNELKMLTGERSELKAEIIQLQESRTEQSENNLKQQEEYSIIVKEKEELQAESMRVKAELEKKLEHTMSLLQQETQKNQQLTQNQANQEQKNKHSLQGLEKQLIDLRNSNNQLQTKLHQAEKDLKEEQDVHALLDEKYKQSVQREQTAKVGENALQSKIAKLNNEANTMKASLTKSETECQAIQKSLEAQTSSSLKFEDEVNRLLAEVKSWKMLEDSRNKEMADLEQQILLANEQNETLESGMKLLHDELIVLKEQTELELNRRRMSEDELLHLQLQYEEVQGSYSDTQKQFEDVRAEKLTLLEEKKENDQLLKVLQVKVTEAGSHEAERLKELEIAQHSLANWKERYSQLESKQSVWIQDEQKLKEELDIWQQEIATTEQKWDELRGEKETVDLELLDIGESFELMAHQYRLLQVEHDMKIEQEKQLKEEHLKLSEEYRKLQTEYNEWIELIEQDQE